MSVMLRLPNGCDNHLAPDAWSLIDYFDAENEDEDGRLPHEVRGMSLDEFLADCAAAGRRREEINATLRVVRKAAEPRSRKPRRVTATPIGEEREEREAVERVRAMVADRREIRLGNVCPRCHGEKSTGAERCWTCYQQIKRDIDERGRFIRTIDPIEYVCAALGPACSGRKVPTASSCWSCYQAAGGHTGRTHTKRLRGAKITQDVLDDARRLYDGGQSMRVVAAAILHRTDYKSARSAASSLFEMFNARGWPMRDRCAATGSANLERVALLPQCERVPTQGPRAGQRCERRVGGEPYGGQFLCAKHLPKPELRRREEARRASRDS